VTISCQPLSEIAASQITMTILGLQNKLILVNGLLIMWRRF